MRSLPLWRGLLGFGAGGGIWSFPPADSEGLRGVCGQVFVAGFVGFGEAWRAAV
jgi:hypothetical protein